MTHVLLFDCDGVLGDTEQFGHLPAFNRMWQEFGVPWSWSVEEYGRKLQIGGGKERMASLFAEPAFCRVCPPPATEEERAALLAAWHKRKTALYTEIIASGQVPARPGIRRLTQEALAAGWVLGVCSTSAPDAVQAVLTHAVGPENAARFSLLLAGDVVKKKKPAPDIYLLAAQQLGVSPAECLVIEDSRNGLLAAQQAGMRCLITVSGYTADEDFSAAQLVVSSLGDPDGEPCRVLANRSAATPGRYVTVSDLERILNG